MALKLLVKRKLHKLSQTAKIQSAQIIFRDASIERVSETLEISTLKALQEKFKPQDFA